MLKVEAQIRIAILGGTFDPPHCGHLAIGDAVRARLGLERAALMPAGRPWLKSERRVAPAVHRLAMTRLAVAGRSGLEACAMEIDRPGPTYTVDTLTELRRRLGADARLWLALGMDSVRELPRWRDAERLFEMCVVVGVSRPGEADVSESELRARFPNSAGRFTTVRGPLMAVSSTDIRRRVRAGLSIDGLTPPPVADYIREHSLYR